MDTAYNLPFQAYLIVNPNTSPQKIDFGPWTDIQLSHEPEEDCATIKENDEMDLYFNSTDKEARLYLDALECCPSSNRMMRDLFTARLEKRLSSSIEVTLVMMRFVLMCFKYL